MNRLTITNADSASATKTTWSESIWSCIPSATKNRVTKKSRSPRIFATTSRLYGNAESVTPAMSAPIAIEKSASIAK